MDFYLISSASVYSVQRQGCQVDEWFIRLKKTHDEFQCVKAEGTCANVRLLSLRGH